MWAAIACMAAGGARTALAEAEGNASTTQFVADVLAEAGAPWISVRERAAGRLRESVAAQPDAAQALLLRLPALDPRTRAVVVGALVATGAPDVGREALAAVLRLDAGEARTLLVHLMVQRDVQHSIALLLAGDRDAFADPLAWGLGSEAERQKLELLVHLARRADIEGRFLTRKSPTGSTGYYKGQYDLLREHDGRALALDVMLGIALDRALPLPGATAFGPYRLLAPNQADLWELEGMALNAVGELATPEDRAHVREVERVWRDQWRHVGIERRRLELGLRRGDPMRGKRFQEDLLLLGDDVAEVADLITTLYIIDPDRYALDLEDFLRDLRDNWQWPVYPQQVMGMRPSVLIRVGRYEEAIGLYSDEMRQGMEASRAFNYYNMACAYASWSLAEPEPRANQLRLRAQSALRLSYEHGWRDVGWMDEDRDLDPIRDSEAYRNVKVRILADLGQPIPPELR